MGETLACMTMIESWPPPGVKQKMLHNEGDVIYPIGVGRQFRCGSVQTGKQQGLECGQGVVGFVSAGKAFAPPPQFLAA